MRNKYQKFIERRRNKRVIHFEQCKILSSQSEQNGRILDISLLGARVESPELIIGDKVMIICDHELKIEATVIWSVESFSGLEFNEPLNAKKFAF